jgi:hypothetical protein
VKTCFIAILCVALCASCTDGLGSLSRAYPIRVTEKCSIDEVKRIVPSTGSAAKSVLSVEGWVELLDNPARADIGVPELWLFTLETGVAFPKVRQSYVLKSRPDVAKHLGSPPQDGSGFQIDLSISRDLPSGAGANMQLIRRYSDYVLVCSRLIKVLI